jgi:Tfp pilus assembly protein FimT
MKNTTTTSTTRTSGFSLFEMMTFVCILGIMISLAMPLFGNTQQIQQATAKRNAQSFCTLAYSANVAGLNVAAGMTDKVEVLKRLTQGITITKGSLKGREFKMTNMSEQDIQAASEYVNLEKGELVFSGEKSGKTDLQ